MDYKHYSIKIIIRLVLILANMIALSIFVIHIERFFTTTVLATVLIFQIAEIIRYFNKTNAEIHKFVQALKYEDSGTRFVPTSKNYELFNAFNEILEFIEKTRLEKEAQNHFLNVILKNAEVGIITLSGNNNIEIINVAAKQLLNNNKIKSWESLEKQYPDLTAIINKNNTNNREMIDFFNGEENVKLSVIVTQIKILDNPFKIVVFQNIKSEIEQSELDSWNKLIRTLAHEIVNSITPIASLTETGISIVQDEKGTIKEPEDLSKNKIEKLATVIKTIERRSNSLLNFVEDFRKLARIPKPQPTELNLREFFNSIQTFFDASLKNKKIMFSSHFEDANMVIYADKNLLEQIIINLLKNSMHAVNKKK